MLVKYPGLHGTGKLLPAGQCSPIPQPPPPYPLINVTIPDTTSSGTQQNPSGQMRHSEA